MRWGVIGRAPYANESGTRKAKRFIHGGRADVLRALSGAGLNASRGNGPLKPFRTALTARGKFAKQAIVACTRRLLTPTPAPHAQRHDENQNRLQIRRMKNIVALISGLRFHPIGPINLPRPRRSDGPLAPGF